MIFIEVFSTCKVFVFSDAYLRNRNLMRWRSVSHKRTLVWTLTLWSETSTLWKENIRVPNVIFNAQIKNKSYRRRKYRKRKPRKRKFPRLRVFVYGVFVFDTTDSGSPWAPDHDIFKGSSSWKRSGTRGNSPNNRKVRIIEVRLKFDKKNNYTKHSLGFFFFSACVATASKRRSHFVNWVVSPPMCVRNR